MSAPRIFVAFCVLALIPRMAAGQAIIEYSLGMARAGAAAAAKGMGKSIESIFGKVSASLESAGKPTTTKRNRAVNEKAGVPGASVAATSPSDVSPKFSMVCLDEPARITVGLSYTEMVARCGPPAMMTSGADGGLVLYTGNGKEITVTLMGDKVEAVTPKREVKSALVVILQ